MSELVEDYLSVGQMVLVKVDPDSSDPTRFTTELRGWQSGGYLLFDWPDDPAETGVPRPQHKLVVQFLAHGQACGFKTLVVASGTTTATQFRTSWPQHVEVLALRKDERVNVDVTCTVHFSRDKTVEGRLLDISAGGCKICVSPDDGLIGDVSVDFTLEGGLACEKLPAVVRSVTTGTLGSVLGCQFEGLPEVTRHDLQFYVATTVERMRDAKGDTQRVLIVEGDIAHLNQLRDALSISDVHIATASNIVDGFYRLRLRPPDMLVLSAALQGLDMESVCRVVRQTRGFENLPITVYGVTNSAAGERLQQAGATHVVGELLQVPGVVDALVAASVPKGAASAEAGAAPENPPEADPADAGDRTTTIPGPGAVPEPADESAKPAGQPQA